MNQANEQDVTIKEVLMCDKPSCLCDKQQKFTSNVLYLRPENDNQRLILFFRNISNTILTRK